VVQHTIDLSNDDGVIRLRWPKARTARIYRSCCACLEPAAAAWSSAESVLTTKAATLTKAQRDVLEMLSLLTSSTYRRQSILP